MNTHFDPELSRLAFEDRLIEFCEDPRIPVLERARLLAIIAERMDVFFMTRVGRLKRLASNGEQRRAAPVPPEEQLHSIGVEGHRMMRRTYRLCAEVLRELAASDVRIESWESLADEDREQLRRTCASSLGLVHPTVMEPGRAFPHVRNLRPAIFGRTGGNGSAAPTLVVVELPADLPRLVPLNGSHRFVPIEQVIAAQLPAVCDGLAIADAHLFRVTRSAYTELDDDDDVLWDFEQEIVRRPFQEVVRLEVAHTMPQAMRDRLLLELGREDDTGAIGLFAHDMYVIDGLVDLTALEDIAKLDLPQLKLPAVQRRPTRVDHLLAPATSDALLHFPFDDYDTSLERFLAGAARHPDLESIQTTIYRTDRHSDVVAALRAARKRGADATAIVELKASFDERDNIELARSLEADGVRVVLSPTTLKVHAKIALVTFRDPNGGEPRRVALIGTGNLNAVTARSYIDFWLVTADAERTAEVAALFHVLTGEMQPGQIRSKRLLLSPFEMRYRFLGLIERERSHAEAGRPSGIRAIMNGLSDPTIIAALYRASQSGVPIDLVIRGVCLLRPGAPAISENIRIVSLAGHLLQHARVFHFRNAGRDEWFIGSADWRPRNFEVRIEVVTSVTQPDHVALLDRIITETLGARDAWDLRSDGVYARRGQGHPRAGRSGQPNERDVDAELNPGAAPEDPLHADADVEPRMSELLEAEPRAKEGAGAGPHAARNRTPDIPDHAGREVRQQTKALEQRD